MINKDQERKIEDFIQLFKESSNTEEYKQDVIDRKEREIFFSRLNPQDFNNIDEFGFGEIISKLWASGIWTNKDYLVKKIISQNGFQSLKQNLWNLLFAQIDISKRFPGDIKGLGPASLTELLCLSNPKEYGIWNDKARKALGVLGFGNEIPLTKYKIDGVEYKRFNEILKQISIKLESRGFKNSDLLFVDYFLYFVWQENKAHPLVKSIILTENIGLVDKIVLKKEKFTFDHDEVKDHIRDIGEYLGFEAETEKKIANGSIVDVVWKARIANLGVVIYIFEVQSKESTDSLILNLQKAKNNQSVQKLIVVSDNLQLEKIKREVNEIPGDLKKSFTFWDAKDVEETFEKLTEVVKSIEKLDLVKDEFEIEKK